MNIYDISKKAGVSIATISRVINGKSYVSDATRERVLKIIEECGYAPNAFARGLGLNSMHTVGIMCANSSDPYLASAVYYLEQSLRQNDYDALLCCTGYEMEAKQSYLNLLLSKRVDAIILVGSNFVEADNKKNQYILEAAKKVPIMIVNGSMDGENIYSTYCDDLHAVFEATRSLQESGSKQILYLYNSKSYSGNKKLAGYVEAMGSNNPAFEKDKYIQYVNGDVTSVKDHLNSLAKGGLAFDAIMTADDILAIGALKYAKENNLSLPDQLSIIGYNNSIIAQCSDPELTSIDNKLEALCNHCVSTLMGYFNAQQVPKKTVFTAEIIKRGTTRF